MEEGIADLNIGTLGFRAFAELLARHGGAVDSVAPRLRSHINDGIPFARCASVKNLIPANQAKRKRVHQRIAGVAGLKLHLAA